MARETSEKDGGSKSPQEAKIERTPLVVPEFCVFFTSSKYYFFKKNCMHIFSRLVRMCLFSKVNVSARIMIKLVYNAARFMNKARITFNKLSTLLKQIEIEIERHPHFK